MAFLRDNTCDEFIDSLSYKDLVFIKKLLKKIAHSESYRSVPTENGFSYEFFDNEEAIRNEINYHYSKERERKRIRQQKRREQIQRLFNLNKNH
jgi:hypothetical protein